MNKISLRFNGFLTKKVALSRLIIMGELEKPTGGHGDTETRGWWVEKRLKTRRRMREKKRTFVRVYASKREGRTQNPQSGTQKAQKGGGNTEGKRVNGELSTVNGGRTRGSAGILPATGIGWEVKNALTGGDEGEESTADERR